MNGALRAGILAAGLALVIDQAAKLWLVHAFELGRRGIVEVGPFFDLVLAWNTGISYGWLQTDSVAGQWLLLAFKGVAVVALAIWMARSHTFAATVGLGLIIGGAIGNAIDRLAYGAVVDFVLLHLRIGETLYNWYVFNLADVAIVAGVCLLLYDTLRGPGAAKAP